MLHIRAISMGNLLGNTFDALLSRLRGQPAEGSHLHDELQIFGLVLTALPGLARRMRARDEGATTRGG